MLNWPSGLCPINGGFAPFVRSLSGGQALSGFEQVQPQLHDRWTASFSFRIFGKAEIFRMRSLLMQLRGRAGTILVPTFENSRAPWSPPTPGAPIGAAVIDPPFWRRWPELADTVFEYSALTAITGTATITSGGRATFAATGTPPQIGQWVTLDGERRYITTVNGSGPYDLEFEPMVAIGPSTHGVIDARVSGAAAINSPTVDVQFYAGSPPLPGNFFSLGNRLYAINTVTPTGGPNNYRLNIFPWLRAAAVAGDVANFASPACEMRLASDGEGLDTLRGLTLRKLGDVTLSFDEVAV